MAIVTPFQVNPAIEGVFPIRFEGVILSYGRDEMFGMIPTNIFLAEIFDNQGE